MYEGLTDYFYIFIYINQQIIFRDLLSGHAVVSVLHFKGDNKKPLLHHNAIRRFNTNLI